MQRGLAVSLLLVSSSAHADRRLFTFTFEYSTVPEGATTVELWHTQSRTTWDSDDVDAVTLLESVVEIEHGLTDHWDAGLLMTFTELASDTPAIDPEPFSFHELQLETRYRFADRGEWPVDVIAYGQAAKEFGASVYTIEARGIVARDFDKFTAAANILGVLEINNEPLQDGGLDLGWAAGVTYEVHPKLNVGVETFGVVELDEDEVLASLGPAFAFAPSRNLWLTVTAGFGVDEAPAVTGRMILGIEL